jgi:hypothetical protein
VREFRRVSLSNQVRNSSPKNHEFQEQTIERGGPEMKG